MKKRYICKLEPTWVADETINLGRFIPSRMDLKNHPTIYQIIKGIKKLTHYYVMGSGENETKYYLVVNKHGRANNPSYHTEVGPKDCGVWLLGENGILLELSKGDGRSETAQIPFLLSMLYLRQADAPDDKKAPGGFLACGDDSMDEAYFNVPGSRRDTRLARTDLDDCLYYDTSCVLAEENWYDRKDQVRNDIRNGKLKEEDAPSFNTSPRERLMEQYHLGTMSFRCMARFFLPPHVNNVSASDRQLMDVLIPKLTSGEIAFVDIEVDDRQKVTVTGADAKKFEKLRAEVGNEYAAREWAPGPGWVATEVYNNVKLQYAIVFHKSGTVLFEDAINGTQFVASVDEDSYFASELPPGSSFDRGYQALLGLAPYEAREFPKRKVSPLKAGVIRQGEWFFVPTKDTIYHPVEHPRESMLFETINMPRDDISSSLHTLSVGRVSASSTHPSDHTGILGGWVHVPTGTVWVQQGIMEHSEGDHVDVQIPPSDSVTGMPYNQAYQVVRNLAIRSYSEEGVD